ncbi:MAG: C39 family peptidase [Patescibacteria group bacterium]
MTLNYDKLKKDSIFFGLLKFAVFVFLLILIFLLFTEKITYEEKTDIQNISEKPVDIKKDVISKIELPPIIEDAVNVKEVTSKVLLNGHKWVPQTYNDCGPATTSMILQDFGYSVSQKDIKKTLRKNFYDRNVFLYEIQDYLKNNYDEIESKILYNGQIEKLKLLLANDFYIILEHWIHPNEDIGHFSILIGYDDEEGVFIVDDSYLGTKTKFKYKEFDDLQWKAFNRRYMPVYKKDDEKILKKIIGEDWYENTMHQNSILRNKESIEKNPNDAYAWFNIGASYYALKEYQNSFEAFEKSENIGWPSRMLWYQIYPVQTANAIKNYNKALKLADIGLKNNDSFVELHYEKAIAYKALSNFESLNNELILILKYDPNNQKAKDMLLGE